MCSINHDLKAIFIHVHKTGGSYIASILKQYYGFETYYLKRPDHDTFCLNKRKNPHQKNYENRVHGVYIYYKTSPHLNAKMNMTPQKWESYYKFTFIRNPYDRMISGWNHMNKQIPFPKYVTMKNIVSDMEYIHVFMSQAKHLLNERNELCVQFIGHFETLEEDLDKVLNHLKIYYRIHNPYQRVNSHAHAHYSVYYDQTTLNIVNELIKDDLKYFDYKKCENMEDLQKYTSSSNQTLNKDLIYNTEVDLSENTNDNSSFTCDTCDTCDTRDGVASTFCSKGEKKVEIQEDDEGDFEYIYPKYNEKNESIENMIFVNDALNKIIDQLK